MCTYNTCYVHNPKAINSLQPFYTMHFLSPIVYNLMTMKLSDLEALAVCKLA